MYNEYYQVPVQDDRFILAPFLLGGLAGTALGYGISTSNQNNYYRPYPVYPYPIYPTNYNYFY